MPEQPRVDVPLLTETYPSTCPRCRHASGLPYRATTSGAKSPTVVGVRCAECKHEWVIEIPPRLTL